MQKVPGQLYSFHRSISVFVEDRRELSANATALTSKYPKTSSVFAGRYIEDDLQDCWTAVPLGKDLHCRMPA